MMFISVDLPDPDGPMMATYSPRQIVTSTPWRARITVSPMGKLRVSARVTMTSFAAVGACIGGSDRGAGLAFNG